MELEFLSFRVSFLGFSREFRWSSDAESVQAKMIEIVGNTSFEFQVFRNSNGKTVKHDHNQMNQMNFRMK